MPLTCSQPEPITIRVELRNHPLFGLDSFVIFREAVVTKSEMSQEHPVDKWLRTRSKPVRFLLRIVGIIVLYYILPPFSCLAALQNTGMAQFSCLQESNWGDWRMDVFFPDRPDPLERLNLPNQNQ